MLQFDRYTKSYGDSTVITILQRCLKEGLYWLQGENGSGKTTVLKSIAGMISFDGTITVADTTIRRQRMRYKRLVNYAEAEPVYPHFLTGSDLLRFHEKTKGGDKNKHAALIQAFGADKYIKKSVQTYSSGMLKKLSLILAFVGFPKLILLDEPLITMDTEAVGILQTWISQYHQEGVSFLITSHQAFENPVFPVSHLHLKNATLI